MVVTGGMPEMVFEYILKENGIDPEKDLTIIQNIDFGSTAPAFADGRGDFTIEFEPGATSLESEGKGHVIAWQRQRLCSLHRIQRQKKLSERKP